MLLLSAPKQTFRKDASQGVKCVGDLDIREVTPETLTELLGLPGMSVTHFAIEQVVIEGEKVEYVHLFCEHVHDMTVCPRCEKVMKTGYAAKDRSVRHVDIWGKRTILHDEQRRFECLVCGQPFTESLVWLGRKRRQTCAFEQHIYECIKEQKPVLSLSKGCLENALRCRKA